MRTALSSLAKASIHDELRTLWSELSRLSPVPIQEEVRQLRTEVTRVNPAAVQAELRQLRTELTRAVQIILLNICLDMTEDEAQKCAAAVYATPR